MESPIALLIRRDALEDYWSTTMKHRTMSLRHTALLLMGGVALGQALRPSESDATSYECIAYTRAAFVEVRRIEGDGDLDAQQMAWHATVQLMLPEMSIGFWDSTLPGETWYAGRGDGP